MKHNPGCPFAPKCPHENGPKCAHPKKKNNQNNNNNSSNNNASPNNSQNNNVCPHSHMPNNQNFPNNNGPYNNNNMQNNNNNNYNNDGSNNSSPSKITYVYDEQNRNNIPYSGQGNNNNQNNNIPYGNNGPNYGPNNNINNNGPYNNYNNPNNNNNYPNNNGPYSQNNNNNPNGPNQNNGNNNEDECPMSPISSAYPPNDEEGQKSNWVFCPKCNVYHRCPHPGCEHNEQKRTTTHKCIHEDENNQNDPNNNNANFLNNNQGSMNNSGMGQGGKSTGRKSKKSGVFASCPYQEELGQFVDFLGLLMEVESRIEDMKIDLARREDFNFEDLFRMFEVDGKGYIEPEDLKEGLKLLGLNPSNNDIKLLMKRFDLNQQGLLSYTDFFDMVVSFEKRLRNTVQVRPPNSCCSCKSPDIFECDTLIGIKNLFKFIIQCETEINNRRKNFDSLRSKYSDVVQFLDYSRRGVINRSDLKLYLTQFNKFTNSKECDLLFIRLDKTRSGEVGIDEIENELMFIR
jgi:Ca2+-binding EF-hand superfamily protein